jgi:hypothetical protein
VFVNLNFPHIQVVGTHTVYVAYDPERPLQE